MNVLAERADGVANTELNFASVGDYVALLKPRVMSLVVFTGVVGLVLAPGHIHVATALTALLCIAVGAGASGALNMAYDSDIDALMTRTMGRPVPQGHLTAGTAAAFGATLSIGAVTVMGLFVNLVAAALLAFTIGFYVFVYTMWLKRRTPQNIVIGGLAGALPPAIGWAAVTGSLALPPLVLVAIIFLWTPPHFWALSLYRAEDYARARVPMLPVVSGKSETRRQIVLYTVLVVGCGFAPVILGFAGPLYLAANAGIGLWFLAQSIRVARERDTVRETQAKRLFGVSILYLFALFAALLVEQAAGFASFPPLALG
ncbi:MAG TPA: heme o synthase [Micropepsaceae bacterium]|nr:heme o synthase [Micropepsaceae bacterium]